jgi:hypothetical protein
MTQYLVKIAISVGLLVAVSEVSKRSTTFGALLASIPIVSVLAMIWMHVETADDARVADLSFDIFWLVIPSLALFVVLKHYLMTTDADFVRALGRGTSEGARCTGAAGALHNPVQSGADSAGQEATGWRGNHEKTSSGLPPTGGGGFCQPKGVGPLGFEPRTKGL